MSPGFERLIYRANFFPHCFSLPIPTLPKNMESTKYTCKHGTTNLLNSKNYHSWKNALTIYLRSENSLQVVLGMSNHPQVTPRFMSGKATRSASAVHCRCCTHPVNNHSAMSSTSSPTSTQPRSGYSTNDAIRQPLPPADSQPGEFSYSPP